MPTRFCIFFPYFLRTGGYRIQKGLNADFLLDQSHWLCWRAFCGASGYENLFPVSQLNRSDGSDRAMRGVLLTPMLILAGSCRRGIRLSGGNPSVEFRYGN
jgi:hypothetical protein